MEELFDEIIYCKNIAICREDKSHPCATINAVQGDSVDLFSVPEPWNGNLNAKVLFISSNPSIDSEEVFPNRTWKRSDISDFFNNRFDGKVNSWVKDNKYILLKNGEYRCSNVNFWASVGARAKELYGREDIAYGQDFCITEIVKCKSQKEKGVTKASKECADKYLAKLLALSPAKLIVVLGTNAKSRFIQKYPTHSEVYNEDALIENKLRDVLFLPHPNARCKRKVEDWIDNAKLQRIRERVNS